MSAPTKMRRTETVMVGRERFQVPDETAKAVLVLLKGALIGEEEIVLASDSQTIKKLDTKYTRAGACLRGARLKEDMSQVDLATKLSITQSNLSKMEHGKRPIGKGMAKRIAKALNVDYRLFL